MASVSAFNVVLKLLLKIKRVEISFYVVYVDVHLIFANGALG